MGGDDSVTGSIGNDTIEGGAGNDTVRGGLGNDILTDTIGDNQLFGEGGNDTLSGKGGRLDGGDGDDVLTGGALSFGGAGNDTITTGGFTTQGGTGDDLLIQTFGVGSVFGDEGNDTVRSIGIGGDFSGRTGIGAPGPREIFLGGGDGIDTLDFSQTTQGAIIGMTANLITTVRFGSLSPINEFSYSGFEVIIGTSFGDVLLESGSIDTLIGGDGNDLIIVDGDVKGSEVFDGGIGNDTLDMGAVTDDIVISRFFDSVSGFPNAIGFENFFTGSGNDSVIGLGDDEHFRGGAGSDTLRGASGEDLIEGGIGNDSLYGGIGNDTIRGEDGNDRLFGESGNDLMVGGAGDDVFFADFGDDTLDAGAGNDTLYGGAGADVFVVENNYGLIRIEDFDFRVDRIDISGWDPVIQAALTVPGFFDVLGPGEENGAYEFAGTSLVIVNGLSEDITFGSEIFIL